ncbi:hypothetical protein QBC34DRAFT_111616 [Podospora aff. communis PSN243]|uniref:N-acetyltransferase domain-containing protein n=1 Tax=Podospora aff. communis PSN243 TaxID=3040156 RepID=A0AAV9GIL5_9PEZI|nr:hypothetical protein QBC34DRAFT_111616 [Podospora aff. communis PSN243]
MADISRLRPSRPAAKGVDSKESTDLFLSAVGMADKHLKQSSSRPGTPRPPANSNMKPSPVAKANVAVAIPLQLLKREPRHFNSPKAPVKPSPPRAKPQPAQMPAQQKPRPSENRTAVQEPQHADKRQHEQQSRQRNQQPTPRNGRNGAGNASNRADIMSLDSASLCSPDPLQYRAPRKKGDGEDSSAPSLPSVSSFRSIPFEGDEPATPRSKDLPSDVRNAVGLDRSLQVQGDKWEANKYSDEHFTESQYLKSFIVSWRASIPCNVLVEDVASHSQSDIDTVTGRYLPPLDHPETFPTIVNKKEVGMDWRRQTWSSALLAHRSVALKIQQGRHAELEAARETPEDRAEVAEAARKLGEFLMNRPPWCIFSPRTPCHLRPVRPEDLAGIVEIYNWEVENGYQALDSKPLTVSEFATVVKRTQDLGMPFLVAVYGPAEKVKPSAGNVFYTSVTPHPDATRAPDQAQIGKVLGFAFLSVWEPGLAGSGLGSGRTTAKISLFVHPKYRRKRIGCSLFDKMLSTVSDTYCSTEGYDFVDLSDNPTYKSARENNRKYYRIFTNFLVRHKFQDDKKKPKLKARQATYETELGYIKKMLLELFKFEEHGRFSMVHRTPNTRPGPVNWLDSVVFAHTCWFNIDDENDIVYGVKY